MVAESSDFDLDTTFWWMPLPAKRTILEPPVTAPATLDELLQSTTFTDYGRLHDYKRYHDTGLEPHAYNAVTMLKRIQNHALQLTPHEEADLVIRYILTKEPSDSINYLANSYAIPAITWELALGGFHSGSNKQRAWEKLMHADKRREESLFRRQDVLLTNGSSRRRS